MLKDPGGHWTKVLPHFDSIGIAYEEWSAAELCRRMPILDPGLFGPPKRQDDPAFWKPADGVIDGAIFVGEAGYVNDPQLAAQQPAAGR